MAYNEKAALKEILGETKKLGTVSPLQEDVKKVVVCRSKKGRTTDVSLAFQDQTKFYKDCLVKPFNKAVYKNVVKGYTFKQKIYFYLPYKMKRFSKK